MFMTSYKEMYRGITAHIPRSFLLALSKIIINNTCYSRFQLFLIRKHLYIPGPKLFLPLPGLPNLDSLKKTRMPIDSPRRYAPSQIPGCAPHPGPDLPRRRSQRTISWVYRLCACCKLKYL